MICLFTKQICSFIKRFAEIDRFIQLIIDTETRTNKIVLICVVLCDLEGFLESVCVFMFECRCRCRCIHVCVSGCVGVGVVVVVVE